MGVYWDRTIIPVLSNAGGHAMRFTRQNIAEMGIIGMIIGQKSSWWVEVQLKAHKNDRNSESLKSRFALFFNSGERILIDNWRSGWSKIRISLTNSFVL